MELNLHGAALSSKKAYRITWYLLQLAIMSNVSYIDCHPSWGMF